jgi:hypothetical protein
VARVRANLDALSALRELQRAGWAASAEEQATLARWSSSGAVPEVFDPARVEFGWARDALAGLLAAER